MASEAAPTCPYSLPADITLTDPYLIRARQTELQIRSFIVTLAAASSAFLNAFPLRKQLLTFLLSHAFVLPGAAKQHQPHSLSFGEPLVDRQPGNRSAPAPAPQRSHRWCCGPCLGRFLQLKPPTLLPAARCCSPDSPAVHSTELPTNEVAEPRKGEYRGWPTGREYAPVNEFRIYFFFFCWEGGREEKESGN